MAEILQEVHSLCNMHPCALFFGPEHPRGVICVRFNLSYIIHILLLYAHWVLPLPRLSHSEQCTVLNAPLSKRVMELEADLKEERKARLRLERKFGSQVKPLRAQWHAATLPGLGLRL